MKLRARWTQPQSIGWVESHHGILAFSYSIQVNDAIDKILRKRHTTCLFVAHRLSTIARAERIVVLESSYSFFQLRSFQLIFVSRRTYHRIGYIQTVGEYNFFSKSFICSCMTRSIARGLVSERSWMLSLMPLRAKVSRDQTLNQ